jgi:hypothetical protein
MKTAFQAQHGFPVAIDVGLSLGDSMTGILGPTENRKCTALGYVPGRSRRLQTAGKLLRARLGEADRAVLDREVLLKLTEPFTIEEFPLTAGDTLRDLEDRSLFFLKVDPPAKLALPPQPAAAPGETGKPTAAA